MRQAPVFADFLTGRAFSHGIPRGFIRAEVTAYPEKEWNELKADREAHGGCRDDPVGREANLERKEAAKITCQTEFWFNIADFF